MIYDIAQTLQEVLDGAIHVASEPALNEEMTRNAQVLEAERLRSTESLQRNSKAELDQIEQAAKIQKQKKLDAERERVRRLKDDSNSEPDVASVQAKGGLQFDQPMMLEDAKGVTKTFRTVQNLVEYRRGPITKVYRVQIWGSPADAPSPMVLKQYRAKCNETDAETLRRYIQDVESKIDFLKQLGQHPSVVQPLGLLVRRSTSENETAPADPTTTGDASTESPNTSEEWTFSIVLPYLERGSMQDIFEIAGAIDIENFRAWTVQLIEGLNFLHRNGITHGRVHLRNILIEKKDGIQATAKVVDAASQDVLYQIKDGTRNAPISLPPWIAPESHDTSRRPSNATDIWDLGVCLSQLLFGLDVQLRYSSPAELVDDSDLSLSLRKFMGQIFVPESTKRPSAFELLPSGFLRSHDGVLKSLTGDTHTQVRSTEPKSPRLRRESANTPMASRYRTDFVELGRLGRGGYGEVVKSRNKLDGRFYAVKKITQNTVSALDNVLSEIILLSQLNHPYVVRYVTAWIETESMHEAAMSSASTSETSSIAEDDPTRDEKLPESLDLMSGTGPDIVFGLDSNGDPDHSDKSGNSDNFDNFDKSHRSDKIDKYDGHGEVREENEIQRSQPNSAEAKKRKTRDAHRQSDQLRSRSGFSDAETETDPVVFEASENARATLYIQMEFCEKKTLRSLINGNIQEDNLESWRLFRQIVDALAYIHAADIVHRDLKPENVFIDAAGDIRIGDFGLARPGELQAAQKYRSGKEATYGSFTKSVGTAFYVAPEVRSTSKGGYNDRADMYSLGIMFFEMCFLLKTGMERITTLTGLRQKEHQLPTDFERPEKATQGEIILNLVDHDPKRRLRSSELMHSDKFPVEIEQEREARDIIRALRDDGTGLLRQQVPRAIFAQADEASLAEDARLIEDLDVKNGSLLGSQLSVAAVDAFKATPEETDFEPKSASETSSDMCLIRQWVRQQIIAVFRHHGAVETERPHMIPYAPHFARYRSSAVRIISKKGAILQLPYDLTVPNAHTLAKTAKIARKSFTFATVYRENPGGLVPWTHQEVDFDIVSEDDGFSELRDAESIKVIDELINTFPSMTRVQMCYHLNHSSILNAILAFCEIPRSKWATVKEILEKLNLEGYNWTKIRSELRSSSVGLRATSVEELIRFDFRDSLEGAFSTLRTNMRDTDQVLFRSEFNQLQALTRYLDRMNIKRKIYIYPLACVNERFFHDNLFFQCIYDTPKKAVFAIGGRYDQLIRQYRTVNLPRSKMLDRHAVGFALNWDQICTTMSRFLKAGVKGKNKKKLDIESYDLAIPQRCDVLVDGPDELLTTMGVEVVQDLWANDLSAELSLDVAGKGVAYDPSEGAKESHIWIVMIKQDGNLKVRNVAKREDDEMRASELSTWLYSEMRERDRIEARTTGRAKLIRHASHPEPVNDSSTELHVRVIFNSEGNKAKKINRPTLVKEANIGARDAMQGILACPIVAIETNNDLFNIIRKTRFTDPDSWRSTIQATAAEDRAYTRKIQSNVETIAKERRPQYVFLFNFRTKACELWDLTS